MKPTIVLFDIDGTLIVAGGAGRRALETAFERCVNRPDALEHVRFGGMTDRLILQQAFDAIGIPFEEKLAQEIFRTYVAALEDELERAEHFRVLPGASDMIRLVRDAAGLSVGLGTGNIEAGARLKLKRGGLWKHFSFGGFGDDHADRGELLRSGAERGAKQLDCPLSRCRVVTIGDTPRDVHATRRLAELCPGVETESIGVTTGSFSSEELTLAGADYVFAGLQADGVLDAIRLPS